MCGLCGVLNFTGAPADEELLGRMIEAVAHRGPDDRGVWTNGGIGLAHARLSIIDLEGGHQPLSNEDGSVWVTFNGEIFNHVELRAELERRGHRFSTRADTEVIVHLYEEDGADCVRRFNGQWAFALWDMRQRRLLLSRDRLGVRPLYYTRQRGRLLFASEIKCLLADPGVHREIDLAALDQIFTFWCPIPPHTLLRDVHELPPGCNLSVAEDRMELRPYWRLEYGADVGELPESELAERLRDLLVDAVRVRLRADVPVGAYLSGGLDSTLVTALVRRFARASLRTFSVTFEDPEFDESAYQKSAVRHLATDHHAVRCTRDDIGRVFPDVVWHAEKPVLRTAPAPLFILSRLVRQCGYKVVLTGEGADEVLGGYDIYKEAKIRRFWAAQPHSRRRSLLLRRLYPYLTHIQSQPDAYLRAFFRARAEDLADPYFSHLPRWGLTAKLKEFFSADVQAALAGYDARAELAELLDPNFSRWDPFTRAEHLETRLLLPGYILSSQGDRMSMAHAVEGRFPFLDHRVVEFACRLPPRLKMRALDEKYLLKRAAGDLLPDAVLSRPKQPYRAPEAPCFWDADGPRHDYVGELLSPARLAAGGLFDAAAVGKLIDKVRAGRAIGIKDNMACVGILSTQLAVEMFVNRIESWVGRGTCRSRNPRVHR